MTIVQKILSAKSITEVLDPTIPNSFRDTVKLIHPDICKEAGAEDAFKRIYELNEAYLYGDTYKDESGIFKSNRKSVTFEGEKSLLKKSLDNYNKLKAFRAADFNHEHFAKYIPKTFELDDTLIGTFEGESIPLSGLILDQNHANWILSRILEYCILVAQTGYVHCGLNPESIFVVPETHGIIVTSFYHLTKQGSQVKTITGQYKNWYPANLFSNKTAMPIVDIELAKKTTIYLLGDKSGSGIRLKKTKNKPFMAFVTKQHIDPVQAYKEYRETLKANFEKKFYILDL